MTAFYLAAGGLIAVVFGALAVAYFETFVLSILFIRASLDAVKGGSSLNPAAAVAVGFLGVAVVWLMLHRGSIRGQRSLLSAPLMAFFAAGVISVSASGHPSVSATECARIGAAVVMALVLNRMMSDSARVKKILGIAFASMAIPLLVAAFQIVQGKGKFTRGGFSSVHGTFLHPNPFGFYLAIMIVMGAALLPHLERRWRPHMIALLGSGAIFLIFTYTRSAWIACALGLFVVGFFQSRKLIPIMLIGGVAVLMLAPSVSARFNDLSEQRSLTGRPENSLIWRFDYWTAALSLAKNDPITGVGLKEVAEDSEGGKNVHNDFIRAYVETGLLGLGAYLWMITAFARTVRRSLKYARKGYERGVAVGFAGAALGFVTYSITGNLISQVVILWYFFTFAVAATAVARLGKLAQEQQRAVARRPAAAPLRVSA